MQPRKKRGRDFSLEMLEGRQLLSAGEGSTFAIMPGTIASAGQVSSVQFKIDPSQFTPAKGGKILLGIDVAASPGSTVEPEIISVKDARGHVAASLIHSVYTAQIIKAKKTDRPDQLGRPAQASGPQGRPGSGRLHGAGAGRSQDHRSLPARFLSPR